MVWDAVGFDDPLVPAHGDRDLVLGGRGAVGFLERRTGRQQGHRQQGEEGRVHGIRIAWTPLSLR